MTNWPTPPPEHQYSNHADSMGCVSFSAIHCIESQEIKMYGKTNEYSERALAKLSNTTHTGNGVMNVFNAIKKYGLILEKDWPTTGDWTWDDFYAPIPQEILDKAVKVDVDLVASDDVNVAPVWTELQLYGSQLHMVEGINDKEFFDSYEQYVKPYDSNHIILWQGLLVLKGTPMQFKTQNYKGELRIVLQADDMPTWNALCKVYGVDPTKFDETV